MKNENINSPTHLENITLNLDSESVKEWKGKLITSAGDKFRIKYYGEILKQYNIIVGTDFAPPLLFAESVGSGELFLLFDGCRHGYNALFCDEFSENQINNRTVDKYFTDKSGEDVFEIQIRVFYNIDYEEEFETEEDESEIELITGEKIPLAVLKKDGFDAIAIDVISSKDIKTTVLEEELA